MEKTQLTEEQETKAREERHAKANEECDEIGRLLEKLDGVMFRVALTYGTGDPLYRLIKNALDGARDWETSLRDAEVAWGAYESALPDIHQHETEKWGNAPAIKEVDSEEAERRRFSLRATLAIKGVDKEDLRAHMEWVREDFNSPISLHVLYGTPKEEAVKVLEGALSWLKSEWGQLTSLGHKNFDTTSREPYPKDVEDPF